MSTLSLSLLALGAIQGAAAARISQREQTCQKTQVVILGAGMAGVNAAVALNNNSVTDFLLVEYQDHVGGRMHSVPFGMNNETGEPYTVEAGANWVQGLGSEGGPENPIWTLAKKYNITNSESDFDNLTYYDQNGLADYGYLLDEFYDIWDECAVLAGEILMENLQDHSCRTALMLEGWNPSGDPYKQVIEWWNVDGEYAYAPEESSLVFTEVAANATFQYFSDENQFVYDQRGFSHILVEELAAFMTEDDPRLLLNTIVTNITYSDDGVTVYTANGTCICADYAINTFSVGVLQNDEVTFEPELPDWKKTAIASFSLGTYTKIYLQFPEVFWDTNVQFVLYADPYQRGYYPTFQTLDGPLVIPGSKIFVGTVVDDQSYRIEAQPDELTQAEVMEVLRAMYGEDIPEPTAFYYPRWTQTPWAHGSFSNWPPSTSLQAHENLRANVGRLFFAGEATSQEFFGYLQGAYFEGRDVATLIAGCISGSMNCTDGNGEPHYPTLVGETPYSLYNEANGWTIDTYTVWEDEYKKSRRV